jgi:hypothetical protein
MKFIRYACATVFSALQIAVAADSPVTFNHDVLPILQKNCQRCHRPGQIAPMSLLTYESSRPWAKAIKTAVLTRTMPPWFADRNYGHFANDPSLSSGDIDTIAKWVDSGAPEGDDKDAPMPVKWPPDGWNIQPDLIIDGPAVDIPADPKGNVMEWMYITIPSGIATDTWIASLEVRPSEPQVTHHICVFFKPHSGGVKYNTPVWADLPRDDAGYAGAESAGGNSRFIPKDILAGARNEGCYVPGRGAQDYRIYHAAKLVRPGTDIVFQLHYTPNGKAVTDHPRIGLTVAKEPPQKRYVSIALSSPRDAGSFAIPPNDPNWESPPAVVEFTSDAELVWMSPHMHLRGKDMTYTLTYPDGRKEIVLSVPHYDFNWQLGYDAAAPIAVPKGTVLTVTAHFDNSANNKFNPAPDRTVYYGDMSWEEMMFPFFAVLVHQDVDLQQILRPVRKFPSSAR